MSHRRKKPPTDQVRRQRKLAALLRRRRGAIDSIQLAGLGFDRWAVDRLVESHRLVREHKGVFRDGTIEPSLETDQRCALLSVGADSLLALESSAHRLGMLQFPPARPQVAVPDGRRRRDRKRFDIHRFPGLEPRDVVVVDGLRCSSPARTILDLAAAARTEAQRRALRRALREAVKANRRVAQRLEEELETRGSFHGSRLLRTVLAENLGGTLTIRSDVEMDFITFCSERGLPIPDTNVVIEGKEVDAAWIKERVAVELDTYTHHGDPIAFEADRAKDEFLRERGWPVSRITAERLRHDGDAVERQSGNGSVSRREPASAAWRPCDIGARGAQRGDTTTQRTTSAARAV